METRCAGEEEKEEEKEVSCETVMHS